MSMSEIVKRNVVLGVVGVVSAILATRLEPFKSNFVFAILAGAGVGVVFAMIESAARSMTKKRS